jgi:hypothetical protein
MTTKNYVIEVKPYSITELSNIYGVTIRTMKNWIQPHNQTVGIKIGRLYTAFQVKVIFEKLGLPSKIEEF